MHKFSKRFFFTAGGVVLLIILIIFIAVPRGDESASQSQQNAPVTSLQKRTTASDARLTASMKTTAVASIRSYPEVKDAAISQDGNAISLVIVVGSATNPQRAQELGDNFVRMVKSQSQDTPPSKEIGTGIYDYLVGVYYPNEKQVAQGAKSRGAKRISW